MAETKLDRLKRWQSRADTARKLRKSWETDYHVRELERMWLGKQEIDRDDQQQFWLNHFFATVQTLRPSLLSRSTSFVVKPKSGRRQPFGTLESQTMEGVLKSIGEQDDNLFNDASLALAQAFFRMGVLKVVYDPVMEDNPRAGEPLRDERLLDEELDDAGRQDDVEPVEGGDNDNVEPDEVVSDEIYRFEWVDAARMLLPDAGPNRRKWPWIGEEITVTLSEAKKDERFRHRSQLVANTKPEDEQDSEVPLAEIGEDDEIDLFTYTEMYDIENKKFVAFATGQDFDDFLIDDDFQEGIEDDPYSILRFLLITGPKPMPWPKPMTYDWMPMQEQYNILRESQVNSAKRAARKFLYEESTFPDEEEIDKFTSNADMQGVTITDANRPPIMFGESSQNPDVARNIPFLMNDWRVVTGASGTRLGDPDAQTATEAVLIEQSSSLRDSESRMQVDKWVASAGKKMLQLVKQTLTLSIWVELRGFSDDEFREFLQRPAVATMLALQFGQQNVPAIIAALEVNPRLQQRFRERFADMKPLQVSRSQLQFEADVEVKPSTARPLQQAQLLRLASVMGPLVFTSPTFLEELLASFDLPQGDRIAEELMMTVRQFQQGQQQGDQGGGSPLSGAAQRNGASQLTRRGPLGTVGGGARL
ncbi:MAG: hypothetical protein ACR2QC_11925 [Gammaproteobacteria bacterium]